MANYKQINPTYPTEITGDITYLVSGMATKYNQLNFYLMESHYIRHMYGQ